jgi:lipoprotein NlpI
MTQRNKIGLTVAALAIILVAGFAAYALSKRSNQDVVSYKDPSLSSTETSTFNSRITEIEGKLSESKLSDEDRFKLYMDLGANYVVIGKYSEAKNAFESAGSIMPENIVPFKELLILSGKMHDPKAAQKYYDKLIELDPVNKEFYTQMFSEIK